MDALDALWARLHLWMVFVFGLSSGIAGALIYMGIRCGC